MEQSWEKLHRHHHFFLWKQGNLYLFDEERKKVLKRQLKSLFFEALISVNVEANKMCQRTAKSIMADLLLNGLLEKVMIC